MEKLPDLLRPGLRLVFIGTAAGTHSAEVGAYYAKPGNKFWPTLHTVGLTPRLFAPREYPELARIGIGLTDLCKTAAGMDHEIDPEHFDVSGLRTKIASYRPSAIAFTSKHGAATFLQTSTDKLKYGRQGQDAEGSAMFVLPSPSGLASRYWRLEPWQALAEWFCASESERRSIR